VPVIEQGILFHHTDLLHSFLWSESSLFDMRFLPRWGRGRNDSGHLL